MIDDVKENRDNIEVNRGDIAHNADNLQEYFKDIMNFEAIRLIENVRLEAPDGSESPDGPWPVFVEINDMGSYVYLQVLTLIFLFCNSLVKINNRINS